MLPSLIDSHAHLDYPYDTDIAALISSAAASGIDHIISIAAEPDSLERVMQIAATHKNIFHTAGIHPHEAKFLDSSLWQRIHTCSHSSKCVAIGEIGLDYHYNHSNSDEQLAAFRSQLDFSVDCGKPIVVHTREAERDTFSELSRHANSWAKKYPDRAPGVIHCFTSSATLAKQALDLGYYISFSGIITFKNANDLREIVRSIVPLEKMLVETDSPYLAPIPFRGKPNKPEYTRLVAEKVAEIKGIDFTTVSGQTRKNTIELFQLPIT